MRLSRKLGYGAIGVLVSIAQATLVAAQAQPARQPPSSEPVRVHLTLEADARCATRAKVAEQVHARSQRIVFVDDTGEVPNIRVAIGGASAGDRVAELTVLWPDGRRSERSLSAGSCASAVEALGLLLAMTLDPAAMDAEAAGAEGQAGEGQAGQGAAATDPATVPTPPASADDDAAASNAASSTAPGAASNTASNAQPASSLPTTPAANAPAPLGIAHLAAGAQAQLQSGAAPRAMPGLGVYARLALNGAGWWAPALQLQLAYGWVNGLSEAGGQADLAIASAALDVCPLGLQRPPFWAHACFTSAVGRLTASGSDTYTPRTKHALWSELGGRLLLTLGLTSWAELQGGLGLLAPLQRYRFAFSPEVFHRVPALCLAGHLGAGVRFP